MAKTPAHSLNYPVPGMPPDIPADMKLLAEDVERELSTLKRAADSIGGSLPGQVSDLSKSLNTLTTAYNGHVANHPAPAKAVKANYWYSGKPAGDLTVGSSYVEFGTTTAKVRWQAPYSGIGVFLWYANCGDPGGNRKLRARIDRDQFNATPADATGYQDFFYDNTPGGTWLVNNTYFFDVQAGRSYSLHWSCSGGTVTMSTRYFKVFLLSIPDLTNLSKAEATAMTSFLNSDDFGPETAPGTALDADGNTVTIPTVAPADYLLANAPNAVPGAGGFSFSI